MLFPFLLAVLVCSVRTTAEFSFSNYLPSWSDTSDSVSDGIRYISNAAQEAWNSLKSVDTEEFLDPKTYVPDVSIISTDPNEIRFLLYTDPK